MIEQAFNVVDEPWIPLRRPDGSTVETGLFEALASAGEYLGLAEESPPNHLALFRLLLAALDRALAFSKGERDLAKWRREGFPAQALRTYFEHWRDRFFVFHPTHPFMQAACLDEAVETKDKLSPWTRLALEKSSGVNPTLFDHTLDDKAQPERTGRVLRCLLGLLQCTPGGLVRIFKGSDKAGPASNMAAVIPVGANLLETLILCLAPQSDEADLPEWERDPPKRADFLDGVSRPYAGRDDRYTRLSRSALFKPHADDGSTVLHVRFGAGSAGEENPNLPDPMAAFRRGKDAVYRLTFSEGRALWRDLPSLLPGADSIPQPLILGDARANAAEAGIGGTHQPVLALGLASDKMKLLRWRADRVQLPRTVLENKEAAYYVLQELNIAEETWNALFKVLAAVVGAAHDNPTTQQHLKKGLPARAVYFQRLDEAAPRWLELLAVPGAAPSDAPHGSPMDQEDVDQDERDEAASRFWAFAVLGAVDDAWNAGIGALGESAAMLKAVAVNEGKYHQLRKSLVKRFEPSNTTEGAR